MPNCDSVRQASLSIVIPLYNEEENLDPLIKQIFNVLSTHPNFLELILVDDGSHDRTASLALEFADRFRHIKSLARKIRTDLFPSATAVARLPKCVGGEVEHVWINR